MLCRNGNILSAGLRLTDEPSAVCRVCVDIPAHCHEIIINAQCNDIIIIMC